MTDPEGRQEPQAEDEAKEVGNRLMRTVAWFAVAAVVAMIIVLCALVVYLISSG